MCKSGDERRSGWGLTRLGVGVRDTRRAVGCANRLVEGALSVEWSWRVGGRQQDVECCLRRPSGGLLAVGRGRHAVADDQDVKRQAIGLPAADSTGILVDLMRPTPMGGCCEVGRIGNHHERRVHQRRTVEFAEAVIRRDRSAA